MTVRYSMRYVCPSENPDDDLAATAETIPAQSGTTMMFRIPRRYIPTHPYTMMLSHPSSDVPVILNDR